MLAHQLNDSFSGSDLYIDIESWLNEDAGDPGYQLLSDDDIIEQVTATNEQSDIDNSDDDDDSGDTESIPSNGEVADMLDKCLLWYEQQKESTPTSTLLLKKIRDLASSKRYSNLKQLKLQSFFTKLE